MSITTDIREYADNAIEQGRQVLGQAQSQLNEVTGAVLAPANEFVAELRAQAEKALNLDAIKTAVEPYLAQAKGYRESVTDRAEALLNTAKKDPRVAKAFGTAEQVTVVVVGTVQDRLVKPVQSFAGRTGAPAAKPAAKPATKATAKPATKPATTRAASKSTSAPARKPAARKASSTSTAKATKADNADNA